MLMTARWLLDHDPDPTDADIREAISGQFCRCTGYENVVRSIRWASEHPDGLGSGEAVEPGAADDSAAPGDTVSEEVSA
jgi:carbon-monoxide dehydrogenase small subunit